MVARNKVNRYLITYNTLSNLYRRFFVKELEPLVRSEFSQRLQLDMQTHLLLASLQLICSKLKQSSESDSSSMTWGETTHLYILHDSLSSTRIRFRMTEAETLQTKSYYSCVWLSVDIVWFFVRRRREQELNQINQTKFSATIYPCVNKTWGCSLVFSLPPHTASWYKASVDWCYVIEWQFLQIIYWATGDKSSRLPTNWKVIGSSSGFHWLHV